MSLLAAMDGVEKEGQSEVDGCLKKQQDLPPKTATETKMEDEQSVGVYTVMYTWK